MSKRILVILIIVNIIAWATIQGCTKITYTTDSNSLLEFSKDTLMFDSVFTTIGSISLYLSVINPHDQALLIEDIELEGGEFSSYRINIDGQGVGPTGAEILKMEDVTVLANDSIFIFVEVTIDPTNTSSAFIDEDRLRFHVNGNDQFVNLISYGRNAVFHYQPGNWFNYNNPPENVLECDEVWSSDLPHVIYGPIRVENGCSLTVEAGTEVYVHSGSGIWVQGGSININGTLEEKVVFQGDRLNASYLNYPGQWGLEFPLEFQYEGENIYYTVSRGGIWLDRSTNSSINHAIIKNAKVGIWVDSLGQGAEYALNLSNSEIYNMSSVGILSQGGYIRGVNNLIADCGEACGAFTLGGKILIHLTTFANYWVDGSVRQGSSVYLNDWYESSGDVIQQRPFEEGTEFRNCLIWGNNAEVDDFDELVSNLYNPSIYSSPLFTSCGVDVQNEDFPNNLLDNNCTTDLAPEFVSTFNRDFHLNGNSSVWQGVSSTPPFNASEVSKDLDGQPRSTFSPDRGCFERQ